jgi:hypothetical protein
MTIDHLLEALGESGIAPYVRDGRLRVRAPVGALTDELRAALAAHKGELVDLLTPPSPPVPGICRSCGRPTRVRGSGEYLPRGYRLAWCDSDCGYAEMVATALAQVMEVS